MPGPGTLATMRTALLAALHLAVACTGDKAGGRPSVAEDDDGDDTGGPPAALRISGSRPDAGFGAAVAASGVALWVAEPFAEPAVVYTLDPAGEPTPLLELPRGAGVALGVTASGDLLIGDPLTDGGRVLDRAGEVLLAGAGVGHAVAAGPRGLGTVGLVDTSGEAPLPHRATALAVDGDAVGIGYAFGDAAASFAGNTVPRTVMGDLSGFALAVGDVDGDGAREWLVGAPGADRVRVYADDGTLERTLTGSTGQFGAAVAVADIDADGTDDVLVGAPRSGDGAGAVDLFLGGSEAASATWLGEPGDRLGTAVAMTAGVAVLGAPGAAGRPGAVLVVSLGSSARR